VLQGLFPDDVATAWGDPLEPSAPLYPEEEALVARAVEKRRREFAKGRECARRALERFGRGDVILLSGKDREPLWPPDVTGSITHTGGFCAAAVASRAGYRGLGIDAEPAEPLEPDVAERVCRGDDPGAWGVSSLDRSVVPRLVFSVKEAVYKCQFPATGAFLGFEEVTVELGEGTFCAVLRTFPAPLETGTPFVGRWRKVGTHLVTATWLTRPL
jgi:4'-phosphopantetheinyl transferase EntD